MANGRWLDLRCEGYTWEEVNEVVPLEEEENELLDALSGRSRSPEKAERLAEVQRQLHAVQSAVYARKNPVAA